jgi:exopolysaccharide biosynthesis polyprenyl glycosylphosphotransferase
VRGVAGNTAVTEHNRVQAGLAARDHATWTTAYLRWAAVVDGGCALAAGLLAFEVRFDTQNYRPLIYLLFTAVLPVLWVGSVALAGGYDARFIGVGSDEFRKVLSAGVNLTAAVAVASYAVKFEFARGYVLLSLPVLTALDLVGRHRLRKRLHKLREGGACMQRVVAVGHAPAVADLVAELRRAPYHGLQVVGACLTGGTMLSEIAGVPVYGGLGHVTSAVGHLRADTVAVLACPELNGIRLRELAWDLERTGTDMCVAAALMDVAGPRTTIRPVAGLPLLHVDHPELAGGKQVFKGVFDKLVALTVLMLLAPLFLSVMVAIKLTDGGPVFFRQVRVGKNGHQFKVWKFRTMVVDAEQRKVDLAGLNEAAGALFKMRRDPRVTRSGVWLRRWSLDELPQLFNVLVGSMSLVGPRPALPSEAARYGDHMRRRLVVKPGITGLWQINGRSDLAWDEAVRLDLRYVENWSFALDLQILWKTSSAVFRGHGAYLSGPRLACASRLSLRGWDSAWRLARSPLFSRPTITSAGPWP